MQEMKNQILRNLLRKQEQLQDMQEQIEEMQWQTRKENLHEETNQSAETKQDWQLQQNEQPFKEEKLKGIEFACAPAKEHK